MRVIEGKMKVSRWPFLVLGVCFVVLAAGFVFAPLAIGSRLLGVMFGVFLLLAGAGLLSSVVPGSTVVGVIVLIIGVIAAISPGTGYLVVSFAGGLLLFLGVLGLLAGFALMKYFPVAPVPGGIALIAGIVVSVFPQLGVFMFSGVCALICVAIAVGMFGAWNRLRKAPPANVTIVRD